MGERWQGRVPGGWLAAGLGLAMVLGSGRAVAAPSQLWGDGGELFDPAGRLMDWSFAGYRYGEDPLPTLTPTTTITDHGAVANDSADDTAAFQAAIAAVADSGGVVRVPAGTFELRDQLELPTGVVLQGAGREVTTIEIPVSLTDTIGNAGLDGGGTSSHSFGNAFIEARGSDAGATLATVTARADRGTTALTVSDTSGISPGDWVRIVQTDVDGDLMDRLHSDLMTSGTDLIGDEGMDFHSRVTAVTATTIELERALPVDVEIAWSPTVVAFAPRTTEVGVEHLTIEFPLTSYPGHFKEQGYNAIHFRGLSHSWVRDVEILNADYGVNITGGFFVTVADVILDTTGDRGAIVGHHGLNNGHGGDNLFIGFDIRATFQHDLTNEWYATGVVFTKGRGDNLRMDHHCAAPYQTLWTELDAGLGTEAFTSGGRADRCPKTASYDTLWNVTASAPMDLPPDDFGPRMNFIGFHTEAVAVTSPYDWWFEAITPDQPNLWEAQVARRLGRGSEGSGGEGGASTAGSSMGGASASGGVAAGGSPGGTAMGGPAMGGAANVGGAGIVTSDAADDGGCACRTVGAGGRPLSMSAWLVLAGAAVVVVRLRRAQRRAIA